MEQLICENITKNYKSKDALDSVNLTLEKGKIYGLIGRNGAGKTTLLSILSAQNPPSEGSVVLETEEGRLSVWENEKALSHICFSRELNVGKNTALSATKVKDYLRTASVYLPHWDQELADELIRKFHLDVKQKIGKLSKGMVSMVTIIVALASKADFTFLDEPVSGLDVVAREQFYRILLEEFTETGRTFVVSTHIMEEAADLFEEVIILKEGKLLLKENTEELLESCLHISGKAEEVDRATEGLEKHYEERLGRSKSVMVRLKPGQELPDAEVTVQPMNLEKVFVALWGITVGGALVAGLILALITWLNRGGDVRRMIWYMLAVDCMMTGYFCLQILPISTYMSTVPLMLASGCRRKKVILSSQILKFLNFLGILAVTAIFLLLQSQMKGNQVEIQRMKDMFLMSALLLLSGGSVGNLIGVLYNLIGRWVMILYVILSGLTGGMVGVVTELSSTPDINTFGDLLGNTTFLTAAFVAAPVFIAADLIVSWLVLRRTEVRC